VPNCSGELAFEYCPRCGQRRIDPRELSAVLAQSPFVPVVIGFFGLGVGYFVWGGQALFNYPRPTTDVNRTMGMSGAGVQRDGPRSRFSF
jgi:hypothetical protein